MATITVTVDAPSQIVAGVIAYFAHPARNVVATVVQGSWLKWRNDLAPPMVIVGNAPAFTYAGAAALSPGYRASPSHWWDLGGGLVAPVVGVRIQTFNVWVYAVQPGDFTSLDPTQIANQSELATFALSDLTLAALRDIHGHDFRCTPGKVLGEEERGEAAYGAAVTWGFEVPVPVLGDAYVYEEAQAFGFTTQMVVNGAPSVPGDAPAGP